MTSSVFSCIALQIEFGPSFAREDIVLLPGLPDHIANIEPFAVNDNANLLDQTRLDEFPQNIHRTPPSKTEIKIVLKQYTRKHLKCQVFVYVHQAPMPVS